MALCRQAKIETSVLTVVLDMTEPISTLVPGVLSETVRVSSSNVIFRSSAFERNGTARVCGFENVPLHAYAVNYSSSTRCTENANGPEHQPHECIILPRSDDPFLATAPRVSGSVCRTARQPLDTISQQTTSCLKESHVTRGTLLCGYDLMRYLDLPTFSFVVFFGFRVLVSQPKQELHWTA